MQTWPHVPQLLGSEDKSKHWELQSVCPAGQVGDGVGEGEVDDDVLDEMMKVDDAVELAERLSEDKVVKDDADDGSVDETAWDLDNGADIVEDVVVDED
jgi:hypothetical protein